VRVWVTTTELDQCAGQIKCDRECKCVCGAGSKGDDDLERLRFSLHCPRRDLVCSRCGRRCVPSLPLVSSGVH
jgi:hypothetical protein